MWTPSRRTFLAGAAAAAAALRFGPSATRRALASPPPPPAGRPRPGQYRLPAGGAMPTRPLGRTGETVSLLGLGGYHIGVQRDPRESVRLVRYALDHGVNFLDNCWDYNRGESEARMGAALREGYRRRAFLMTKLDGRTAAAATAQLEQSLRRLQTDVIDLVQLHEVIRMEDADRAFAAGGAMEALVRAREQGKLRFIGFTGHKDPAIHLHMLETAARNGFRFDTVQMPLNVMDPHYHSFETRVVPALLREQVGVLGMKSMGSGAILRSGVVSPLECLRYAMSLPTSVVISGCDSVGVLEQALYAAYTFRPMDERARETLLARTADAGSTGRFERFKTSDQFDGTSAHPEWLEAAAL